MSSPLKNMCTFSFIIEDERAVTALNWALNYDWPLDDYHENWYGNDIRRAAKNALKRINKKRTKT
ncbi:MAG: hypothetical protein WED07_04395 [Candidatus Freyarchaeum deiterrae]